jgi:hypothetical protein
VCQGFFVAGIVVIAMLAAGCQKSDAPGGPPAPTTVRHDLPELVARFPPIVDPVSADWVTWGEEPGEAEGYWGVEYLDAVVHLKPAAVDALVTVAKPALEGRTPTVQQILRSAVPGGPFLTGSGLDAAFSSANASTYAYLDRGRSVLVLQSTGVRS